MSSEIAVGVAVLPVLAISQTDPIPLELQMVLPAIWSAPLWVWLRVAHTLPGRKWLESFLNCPRRRRMMRQFACSALALEMQNVVADDKGVFAARLCRLPPLALRPISVSGLHDETLGLYRELQLAKFRHAHRNVGYEAQTVLAPQLVLNQVEDLLQALLF